ncbi:hypothetical protein PUN28_000052 [Cardiocondyla obscurior]|uniref:Uncharacterized protein n=1 Tax=Cardiocondyla obscurior TaxID=286306 RepID=A0AAW2GXN1_9HYME
MSSFSGTLVMLGHLIILKQNNSRECDRKFLTIARNHVLCYVYDVPGLAISSGGAFQGFVKLRDGTAYILHFVQMENLIRAYRNISLTIFV